MKARKKGPKESLFRKVHFRSKEKPITELMERLVNCANIVTSPTKSGTDIEKLHLKEFLTNEECKDSKEAYIQDFDV